MSLMLSNAFLILERDGNFLKGRGRWSQRRIVEGKKEWWRCWSFMERGTRKLIRRLTHVQAYRLGIATQLACHIVWQ